MKFNNQQRCTAMNICHNRLRFDYNCKDALDDLKIAIKAAESTRNQEPSRKNGRFAIERKW